MLARRLTYRNLEPGKIEGTLVRLLAYKGSRIAYLHDRKNASRRIGLVEGRYAARRRGFGSNSDIPIRAVFLCRRRPLGVLDIPRSSLRAHLVDDLHDRLPGLGVEVFPSVEQPLQRGLGLAILVLDRTDSCTTVFGNCRFSRRFLRLFESCRG